MVYKFSLILFHAQQFNERKSLSWENKFDMKDS